VRVKSCLAVFLMALVVILALSSRIGPGSPMRAMGPTPPERAGPEDEEGSRSSHDATFGDLPDGCLEWRVLSAKSPPMTGSDVRDLQVYLADKGFYRGALDGVYGRDTADAVRMLQRWLRVPVTGVYDLQTWVEIEGGTPAARAAVPPPEGSVHLRINIDQCRLTIYSDGAVHKSYVVAIGKSETPSPVGEFKVLWKSSGIGGVLGSRWIGLNVPWGMYGIHGTNRPWTVGYMASHGCFRMFNHDVEELYAWVEAGTPVTIEGDISQLRCRDVLRLGSGAQDVVLFQMKIREKGFYDQRADGDFGPATESAVKDMQMFYGFEPTGVTSPDLMRLLGL